MRLMGGGYGAPQPLPAGGRSPRSTGKDAGVQVSRVDAVRPREPGAGQDVEGLGEAVLVLGLDALVVEVVGVTLGAEAGRRQVGDEAVEVRLLVQHQVLPGAGPGLLGLVEDLRLLLDELVDGDEDRVLQARRPFLARSARRFPCRAGSWRRRRRPPPVGGVGVGSGDGRGRGRRRGRPSPAAGEGRRANSPRAATAVTGIRLRRTSIGTSPSLNAPIHRWPKRKLYPPPPGQTSPFGPSAQALTQL